MERWAAWQWLRYELDKAERSMRRAVKLRERVYGADHPDLCNHLGSYAALQRMRGQLAQARTLNERVLRICEKYAGEESVLAASALHDLGSVIEDLGQGDEAERTYRRSIDLLARALRPLPEETEKEQHKEIKERNEALEAQAMAVKCDLAVLLAHMGRHAEAMPYNEELFQKSWNVARWDHPFFHSHLHEAKYWRFEHFNETQRLAAEEEHKESRRRDVEDLGQKEGSLIRLHKEADADNEGWTPAGGGGKGARRAEDAEASDARGQHQARQPSKKLMEAMLALDQQHLEKTRDLSRELAYRKVVDKLSTTLGMEHPALCRHLYYMAHVYMENEAYAEAETMLKRVLSIQKRERGPYSVSTATAWGVLGDLCLRQRNFDDAARLLAQARDVKRDVLGNGHLEVGVLEFEVSGVAQEMGKFNTAISCLKRAREIFSLIPPAKIGEEHREHPWVKVVRTRAERLKTLKEEAMREFIKRTEGQESLDSLSSPEREGLLGQANQSAQQTDRVVDEEPFLPALLKAGMR